MASTPRPSTQEAALLRARAERAARIAAMLDRWAAEDVSDEPAWDVDQIPSLDLRSSAGTSDDPPR